MHISHKKVKSILIKSMAVCVSIPLLYLSAVISLPYIQPICEKMAVVSAGISFFGGGTLAITEDSSLSSNAINCETEPYAYPDIITTQTIAPPVAAKPKEADTVENTIPTNVKIGADAGIIKCQTFKANAGGVYVPLDFGLIKNCTEIKNEEVLKAVAQVPSWKIKADGTPQVLIMHTHSTESYQDKKEGYFIKASSSRTTDPQKNVMRVGDEIEKQLAAAGIGVIHDKTLHDYPSYNGSYERSAETVKKILKDNPTIKVVLDVHRDAIQPNADTMISPVTQINGKDCAQVMIISGCDNGKFNMPNYMENLKLSACLQRRMERLFPTLARPVLFDYRKYNQDLTTGSILLEIGGHANTLDEAIYAGELVGKSLADVLLALK